MISLRRQNRGSLSARPVIALALALTAGAGLAGCQEVVDFTRRPIDKPAEYRMHFAETPVYVTAPIELADLSGQIEATLPEQIVRINQRMRGAACKNVNGRQRCGHATVKGEVVRAGAATLVGDAQALALEIPLSYDFQANGQGSYSDLTDSATGTMSVRYLFDLAIDEDWQVAVRGEGLRIDGAARLTLLNGELNIASMIERVIKSRVRQLRAEIERSLAAPQLKALAADAWRDLHLPVSLGSTSDIWLRGEPSEIRFGGISNANGKAELKFAVMTRMRTALGERPMPLIARGLPKLGLEPLVDGRSALVMPIEIPYSRILMQIRNALPENSELAGGPGGDTKITVKELDAFPSESRLIISTSLAVAVSEQWKGLYGAAHYLTTPVIAEGSTELRLSKVEPAERTQSPSLYHEGAFILPLEPLAVTIGNSVAIDLSEDFAKAQAELNQAVNAQLSERLHLVGEFSQVRVRSIEPLRNALRLNLEVLGELKVGVGNFGPTADTQSLQPSTGSVQ